MTTQNRQLLLELANEAEKQIPVIATNKSLAIFYEYYARILAFEKSDPQRAFEFFDKSLEVYPASENTSICPQRILAQVHGFDSAHLQQFKDVACSE